MTVNCANINHLPIAIWPGVRQPVAINAEHSKCVEKSKITREMFLCLILSVWIVNWSGYSANPLYNWSARLKVTTTYSTV